jgi:N-acetylmuramoyl-L-alanine amidase
MRNSIFICLLTILLLGNILFGYKSVTKHQEAQQLMAKFDNQEIECLAKNIYYESRGSNTQEQVAVAYVTLNRVEHQTVPKTICEVVYDSKMVKGHLVGQFSWTHQHKMLSRKLETEAWIKVKALATEIYYNKETEFKDPTNGATFYYSWKIMKKSPAWAKMGYDKVKLTDHVYMKLASYNY